MIWVAIMIIIIGGPRTNAPVMIIMMVEANGKFFNFAQHPSSGFGTGCRDVIVSTAADCRDVSES